MEIASQVGLPEWVDVDAKKMTGVLKSLPDREDILPDINENLVVELYSKSSEGITPCRNQYTNF